MNKKIRIITSTILISAMALSVYGCSGEAEDPVSIGGQTTISVENNGGEGQAQTSDSFKFTYSGTTVNINTDVAPVLAALGSDYNYFESDSCAYQGKDKVFTYPHFAIYTYPDGDTDMVSSIELKSDVAATEEGIRLGATQADVTAAYGDNYEEVSGVFKYTKGDCVLSFIFSDGEVSGIVYDYKDLRTE